MEPKKRIGKMTLIALLATLFINVMLCGINIFVFSKNIDVMKYTSDMVKQIESKEKDRERMEALVKKLIKLYTIVEKNKD